MFVMRGFYTVIITNMFFSYILGIDVLTQAKKNHKSVYVSGIYILLFSLAGCIANFFLRNSVKAVFHPLISIAAIFIVYLVGFILCRIFFPKKIKKYMNYGIFSAFNSASAGIISYGENLQTIGNCIANSIELSIGFFIAFWMLNIVYDHFCSKIIPEKFRGYPAILVFTGLLSMVIYCIKN